jgi:hypothetical protein
MPSYMRSNLQSDVEKLEIEGSEVTKVGGLFNSLIYGTKAEAAHYFHGNGWESKKEWWREGIRLPGEFIEDAEWFIGHIGWGMFFTWVFSKLKIVPMLCKSIAIYCGAFATFIVAYYNWITTANRFWCNKSGVWIYKNISPEAPYVGCN